MLIQLITQHPEAIAPVLRNTPAWVGGLLAALLLLGFSQVRDRQVGLTRMSLTPIGMTVFSVWGTVAAFGNSPLFAQALAVWLAAAVVAAALILPRRANASYDPATRMYTLPGSLVPLALILGIFSVKYVVGVDLAMAPRLMQDTQYALTAAALYGAFTGIFIGRAARLWRLALAAPSASVLA
ncbi:MAG: putative rane protein [Ramlibacter sp.]|jgi:hypothetical protein|nr:putative rane protein [Ramlibacter sp.]